MNPARSNKVPTRDLVKQLGQRVGQLEQLLKSLYMEFQKLAENANVSRMQTFARFSTFEKAGLIKMLGYDEEKWTALQEQCWQETVADYEAFIEKQVELQQAALEKAKAEQAQTQTVEADKSESTQTSAPVAPEQDGDGDDGGDDDDDRPLPGDGPLNDNIIIFQKK